MRGGTPPDLDSSSSFTIIGTRNDQIHKSTTNYTNQITFFSVVCVWGVEQNEKHNIQHINQTKKVVSGRVRKMLPTN